MKNVSICIVLFDGTISEREIPSFRGAIIALSGNNPMFHNHSEESGDIFRYPKVQYKIMGGCPALVGVAEGADVLKSMFIPGAQHTFRIGRAVRDFTVKGIQSGSFSPEFRDAARYRIHAWLPLNSENYDAYMQSDSLIARVEKLNAILVGNVLSLYKGLDIFLEQEVKATIIDLTPRVVTFKGVRMQAFDSDVQLNITLPEGCGLGKGVSHGFGVITSR